MSVNPPFSPISKKNIFLKNQKENSLSHLSTENKNKFKLKKTNIKENYDGTIYTIMKKFFPAI